MKEIKAFKIGDQIPENAKFIASNILWDVERDSDGNWVQTGDVNTRKSAFLYEVPIKEQSTKQSKDTSIKEICDQVIGHLNMRTGANYKASSKRTQALILARINDGFKLEDFKTVINKKCRDWLDDPKWSQYLRPETLFSPKFESYLNAKTGADMTDEVFGELDRILESKDA
jgi:uncharacterized phage protein (TIGR02220 family)